MKSPLLEAECAKGVFQIQPPISGVNFSNNMSVPQTRVNMNETEHDTTFETALTINHKDKSYSTMLGENRWICSVQITGKCICETPPPFA